MRRSLELSVAVVVMAALTGCGDSTSEGAWPADEPPSTSFTPISTTPPPTPASPAEPPSTPTDPQPQSLVAGRVVRGGGGPCYGVETDEGKLYAVYNTTAGQLAVGTTVVVKVGPDVADVDCGPGQTVAASRIDVVG